jgi:hypothetical protein
MSRPLISLGLALFAIALLAVPSAFAKVGGQRDAVRVQGVCTQNSTSKLKLSREDRGLEVEFEVDQNRNRVPWKVTIRRNGHPVAALTAKTRAPSGSFEIHRVIAGRLTDRLVARATRSGGETCTARSTSRAKAAATTAAADDSGHDVGDDHGGDSGTHS